MAIEAGIDGLVHLFMDQPHTDEIIGMIKDSGAFVAPCVVLNSSMRVASRLDADWDKALRSCFGHYAQGKVEDVLAAVKALGDASVELLAGADVDSDPTTISDTLNTRAIRRRGAHLATA